MVAAAVFSNEVVIPEVSEMALPLGHQDSVKSVMTRRALNLHKQVYQNTYNEVETFVDNWRVEQQTTIPDQPQQQ